MSSKIHNQTFIRAGKTRKQKGKLLNAKVNLTLKFFMTRLYSFISQMIIIAPNIHTHTTYTHITYTHITYTHITYTHKT